MADEKGYSLKEILNETRGKVEKNNQNFLNLKEKYDTQSTAIYEKSKETIHDINSIGRQVRDISTRVSKLELRVYAAASVIMIVGFVIQNFWK